MDRTQTHGDVPDASGNAKVTDQKLPISDAQALITVERRTRGRHAGPGITRGLTLEQGKEKKIKKKTSVQEFATVENGRRRDRQRLPRGPPVRSSYFILGGTTVTARWGAQLRGTNNRRDDSVSWRGVDPVPLHFFLPD